MLRQTLTYIEQALTDEFAKSQPRSLTQLARELGLSDSSALIYHIRKMLKDGRIVKVRKGVYRTIETNASAFEFKIPFFGKGKCGPDGYFLEDVPEYEISISVHLLRSMPQNMFALEASGNSMDPTIHDGDIVIAKKTEVIDPTGIYVVSLQGEILIKKVTILNQSEGRGVLVSINPAYNPITIDDPEEFRVIGKVATVVHHIH